MGPRLRMAVPLAVLIALSVAAPAAAGRAEVIPVDVTTPVDETFPADCFKARST